MGIADAAKNMFDKAKDVVEDALDSDLAHQAKDAIDNALHQGQEAAGEAKDTIENVDEAKIDLDGSGAEPGDAFENAKARAGETFEEAKDAAGDVKDDVDRGL